MDHPTTAGTAGADAATASNADLALNLERMADQLAAMPAPPRVTAGPPPASMFGDQDLADTVAGFYADYAQTAADLAADHDAMIAHLRATAAAYRAGDTEAAEQIMTAALTAAADVPEPPTPPEQTP